MAGLFDKVRHNTVTPRITFVCTGNICRSAYAAASLRYGLSYSNSYSISVDSAGIPGLSGEPMHQFTRERVSNLYGVEFTQHFSQKLDINIVNQNSLFIGMTKQHQKELLFQFPSAVKRTFLLSEFSYLADTLSYSTITSWDSIVKAANDKRTLIPREFQFDIEDPYRKDSSVHDQVYDQIDSLLQPILKILK